MVCVHACVCFSYHLPSSVTLNHINFWGRVSPEPGYSPRPAPEPLSPWAPPVSTVWPCDCAWLVCRSSSRFGGQHVSSRANSLSPLLLLLNYFESRSHSVVHADLGLMSPASASEMTLDIANRGCFLCSYMLLIRSFTFKYPHRPQKPLPLACHTCMRMEVLQSSTF